MLGCYTTGMVFFAKSLLTTTFAILKFGKPNCSGGHPDGHGQRPSKIGETQRSGRAVVPIAIGSGGLKTQYSKKKRSGRADECGGLENR